MVRRLFGQTLLALALIGCSDTNGVPPSSELQQPLIDLSTPDKAIRSYWSVQNFGLAAAEAAASRPGHELKAVEQLLNKVSTEELASAITRRSVQDRYSRDILKVEQETQTRAVVLASIKNVTPIPAGAETDARVLERRETGERFKYVLERTAAGWQVAEVWEFDSLLNRGWLKRAPFDGPPPVPTYVQP